MKMRKKILPVVLILFLACAAVSACFPPSRASGVFGEPIEEKEEIFAVVRSLCKERNNAILSGDLDTLRRFYDTNLRNGRYAYDHEVKKTVYLANWSEKQCVRFTAIQTAIKFKWTRRGNGGSAYTVNFLMSSTYTYAYKDRPEEKNTMRIGTYHEMELVMQNEAWVVAREWYTDPFADSLDLQKLKTADIESVILGGQTRELNISDRRQKAVAYADLYVGAADSGENGYAYNRKYKDYNSMGGDCANFVSQVLFEGGSFKKTGTWTYHKDGSLAWVKAQNLKDYLLYNGRASLIALGNYGQVLTSSYKLLPGDIVAYEKRGRVSHVSVVTGIDSRGYALVNCHNTDRYRVPWDLGWSNKGIRFYFLRVFY
jgi:hypothetical protein